MKNEKTTITINNPFAFTTEELSASTSVRRLDYTPALQEKARAMATELIKTVADRQDAELIEKANQMMDSGDAATLFDLVQDVFGDDRLVEAEACRVGTSKASDHHSVTATFNNHNK